MKIVKSILKVLGVVKDEKAIASELDKKDPAPEDCKKILEANTKWTK